MARVTYLTIQRCYGCGKGTYTLYFAVDGNGRDWKCHDKFMKGEEKQK